MKQLIINPYSFDTYKVERDKSGFGHARVKMMKVGKLRYVDNNGKEYFADVSFDELKKLEGNAFPVPITIRHPKNMLSPKDVLKHQHGVTGGKYKIEDIGGEQWLTTDAVLYTEDAIKTAESGKLGVSTGYWRDAIQIDGDNVKFKDIVPNHLAIGAENPRAKGAGLSLDDQSGDFATVYSFDEQKTQPTHEVTMAKRVLSAVKVGEFSLDEVTVEYADESTATVEKLVEREKSIVKHFETEAVKSKASMDEITGENKALKLKVEKLEAEQKNMISMDEVNQQAEELAEVRQVAKELKVEGDFKNPFDGKKAIVTKVYEGQSFDDSEIPGAYKTIKADPKLAKEDIKSKQALDKAKQSGSMDDGGKKKIPLSQIDVRSLIKIKKTA